MSAKAAAAALPANESAAAPPKGKSKMLLFVLVAVVLAAAAGGGAWFYMGKKSHDAAAAEAAEAAPPKREKPTYLPIENMVVNLSDAGGDRFAQIGLTLDLENEKAAEEVKNVLPAIRSHILMLVSQRSSEELLKRDGKEKLADDIVAEVSRSLGYEVEAPAKKARAAKSEDGDEDSDPPPRKKHRKAGPPSPVHGVLFSSFIVQ